MEKRLNSKFISREGNQCQERAYSDALVSNYYRKFLITAFIFIIIRLIVYLLTDNVEGDASVRIYETLKWMDSPHFITSGVWLPMNYYLSALFLWIFNDALSATRILSFISALLTLLFYCEVVKSYFGEKTAIISGIILAFFLTHIVYSVLGLAASPFLLFVFAAFYLLKKFLDSKNNDWKLLLLAMIVFIIAEMIRIEAWLLIPLFTLFIFLNGLKKEAFCFFCISSVFPVCWLIGCYISTGDFLPLASRNINPENLQNFPMVQKIFIYPYILIKFITPLILLFCFIGLVRNFIEKDKYEFGLCFLVQFFFLITITVIGTNAFPKPRYALLSSLFLIPYFSDGFSIVVDKIKSRRIVII
ncbi:MAG: hypothetical protein D6734_11765, partial [Candidatus Schekmanbacteria bacterium]